MKTVESSAVFQPKQWAEKEAGRQSKTGPNPNLCPIRRQNRTLFDVPISESQLQGAPAFSRGNWDWTDRNRERELHDHYRAPYYWGE